MDVEMNNKTLEDIVKEIKTGFYTDDEKKKKKLMDHLEDALQNHLKVRIKDKSDFQNLCFIYSMSDELKMTNENVEAKESLEKRLMKEACEFE